ncbi:MAG: NAD(P)-dependent oxidoreductase, partial [Candidatus Omnitrophica bacterium]|nr:NAD(P)-dependent oxidoreductase [Candidatus Omnitrophota bacterium]
MGALNGKKVCLVGGAGFIGHNLALHLSEHGAEVAIVDGLNVNNLLQLHSDAQNVANREMYIDFVNQRFKLLRQKGIPLIVEDARDYHKLSKVLGSFKPDVVVLLAAVAHANKSNKDPFETFDHSLRTLENALDASKNQVGHFIYFSSSMIYGHFESGTVTEETVCEPLGIYGSSKYSGEKMVKAYNQAFDLPYTIIRPSALYGERCVSRRVGQIFIENAIAGKPITVQGDGGDRLDFTYIQDLISGVRNVIE